VVITTGTDTMEELAVLCALLHAADAPIVLTGANRPGSRPDRSSMLFGTYGFEGAEQDLRASGAVCVPFLSPAAARIALLCCLGAGLDRGGIAAALAPWDAR
jgi:L-asparaginase/Glu-tRNA(Gln) amidotransferase subunit D